VPIPRTVQGGLSTGLGDIIITLINVPFAFANTVLLVSGFFMLPWYTVLICGTAALLAMLLFWNVPRRVVRRYGLFVAMLISYPVTVLTAIWCFQEEYLISPTLASYIGIAIVLCARVVNALYAKKMFVQRGL